MAMPNIIPYGGGINSRMLSYLKIFVLIDFHFQDAIFPSELFFQLPFKRYPIKNFGSNRADKCENFPRRCSQLPEIMQNTSTKVEVHYLAHPRLPVCENFPIRPRVNQNKIAQVFGLDPRSHPGDFPGDFLDDCFVHARCAIHGTRLLAVAGSLKRPSLRTLRCLYPNTA